MDDPSLGVFGEYGLAAVRGVFNTRGHTHRQGLLVPFQTLLRVIFTVFMMVAMLLPV